MSPVKVFWLDPIGTHRVKLVRSSAAACSIPTNPFGHSAEISIGDLDEHPPLPPLEDPRWPTRCDCGYVFTDTDRRHQSASLVYRRADTGEITTLSEAPVGAMWDLSWYAGTPYHRPGPDGIHLCVRTPGGTWEVYGRASNCTRKDDDVHRCWVRHGDPRTGSVHVDKKGETCAAGAGSIICGNYHGFLHHGYLADA